MAFPTGRSVRPPGRMRGKRQLFHGLDVREVPVPWDLTVHFRGNSLMKDLLPFSAWSACDVGVFEWL